MMRGTVSGSACASTMVDESQSKLPSDAAAKTTRMYIMATYPIVHPNATGRLGGYMPDAARAAVKMPPEVIQEEA